MRHMAVLGTDELYTISGFHSSSMLMLILFLDNDTVIKWTELLTYWTSLMLSSSGPYKCWQHSRLLHRTITQEQNHYQIKVHLYPSAKWSLKLSKLNSTEIDLKHLVWICHVKFDQNQCRSLSTVKITSAFWKIIFKHTSKMSGPSTNWSDA
jgi:hypothetical protein